MVRSEQTLPDYGIPAGLELEEGGARLVSLTFRLTLYTDVLFSSVPDAILACYERFLRLCPPERLKFYLTETMHQHKPVTKRALNLLGTWLQPGAPPRQYVALELNDAEEYNWAPRCEFSVWGGEKGSATYATKGANLISIAFPAVWGLERTSEMIEFVRDICALFPFRSGLAGFCFYCSDYQAEKSHAHAWAKSMRHRGIDVFVLENDSKAVRHDGVKGVGWLTVLGDDFVRQLGGSERIRESLSSAVELAPLPGGLVLQAGRQPRTGDTNRRDFLPDYKDVYKVVKALVERSIARSKSFNLPTDYVEKTRAWWRRFEDD